MAPGRTKPHIATYRAFTKPPAGTSRAVFVSEVKCSCGKFRSQAQSFQSAAAARTAAGRSFNGHVGLMLSEDRSRQAGKSGTSSSGASALSPVADAQPQQTADDENRRLRTTLIGVSMAIVLLVFAVSYLGGDGDEDSSAAVYSPLPSPSPWYPAPTSDASGGRRHGERHGASSGGNQAGETGGSTNYYRGLTRDDIVALGRMADLTGYGLSPSTPLSFSQASDFAIAVTVTCDAVAAGQMTWRDAVNEDIASGAPPSAARQMNNYLRVVFCPETAS